MPFGGALIGGIATIGGSAISGAMSGGGQTTTTGLTLPPEYEFQYFEQFQKNMEQLSAAYTQVQGLYDIYQQRANAAYGAMQGTIPGKQATKLLTQTSSQLAQALGMSASDMVKNGYISEGEAPALQRMQDIAMQGTNYRGDAVTEQSISDQKRQLQQELARQGIPAAQQMIAMQQFEQSAGIQRQQAAGAQSGMLGNFLGQQRASSAQGFNQAVGGLGAMQGQLQYTQGGIQGLAGMAQNQFSTGLGFQQAQQGLRQEGLANYADMGQYKFSGRTLQELSRGTMGPGSFTDQLAGNQGGGGAGSTANATQRGSQLNPNRESSSYGGLSDQGLKSAYYDKSRQPNYQNNTDFRNVEDEMIRRKLLG